MGGLVFFPDCELSTSRHLSPTASGGNRSLALNVGATQARPVVEALTEAFPSCRVRDLSWSVDQRREAAAPLPFPGVAGLIVIS